MKMDIKGITMIRIMDRKNTSLNAIPTIPSIKVGSSLAALMFGIVLVFLMLYLFSFDPDQKQMWLILMIVMIIVGVIVVALTAGRRKTYTRRVRRGYYTRAAPRTQVREKTVVVKHCVKCGKQIPEKAEFCEFCGEKQPTARSKRMKKCEKCGKEIQAKALYCEFCGDKQET